MYRCVRPPLQMYVSVGQTFHYEPLGKVGTLTHSRWRLVKGEPLRVVDVSKVHCLHSLLVLREACHAGAGVTYK